MIAAPLGIACGFLAALFQALSYVASKRFFHHCRPSSTLLFAVGTAQMGGVAVLALPLVWHSPLPPVPTFLGPLLGATGFYLVAQCLLFLCLKRADSSVIAPLLGIKIPMLGILSTVVLNEPLPSSAWAAILLCTMAVFLVSPPADKPHAATLGLVLLTCLAYCGSDLCIPVLVRSVEDASRSPILLAVALTYTICGVVGAALALAIGAFRIPAVHRYAAPYAASWLVAMCFLFAAFSSIGVVFGNMLQSTRGLISVGLAVLLLKLGVSGVDRPAGSGQLIRRACGAALMTAAIVLYYTLL